MVLITRQNTAPIRLQLSRNLVRTIKRGHAWVYIDALRGIPKAPPGSHAILFDNRGGKEIGRGFYNPDGPIALRICTTQPGQELEQDWAESRMRRALGLRAQLFDPSTTGYRLFNGEGDGLPGLVCDIYGKYAVIKLDGTAPERFWDAPGIAAWLQGNLPVNRVYQRYRNPQEEPGRVLLGKPPKGPVHFLENGAAFTADLVEGQKTGFFFDQRGNRARIKPFASGRSVLNLFGYTGGFSVHAGLGGARHVTTLDTAQPALEAADHHWALNDLDPSAHQIVCADAFDFLARQVKQTSLWDLVILDPPSFASSQAAVPQAAKAYTRLISLAAQVAAQDGLLAASSCSSHISDTHFLEICEQAVSLARRKAALLGVYGQAPDHPAPLVMPELRYLKFVLMRLD